MLPKDIEILAHGNKPMPEFASFPEVCLYQAFADLYSRLYMKRVGREQAKAEKMQILKKFSEMNQEQKQYLSVFAYHQDNIRRAGTLLSDIEKSADIREAAFKAFEAVGCMTGDLGFLKRQINKFMEETKNDP